MKALALGIDKKLLRKRALTLKKLTGFDFPSRQTYLTIKGRVNFLLMEETISLRKVPKYSGYTKHYKDKGSLGPEKEEILSEILEPDVNISDEILWHFLSVGDISLFGGEYCLPDENPIGSKRTLVLKKNKK